MNDTFKKIIYILAGILALAIIIFVLGSFSEPLQDSIIDKITFIMRLFNYGD